MCCFKYSVVLKINEIKHSIKKNRDISSPLLDTFKQGRMATLFVVVNPIQYDPALR